MQAKSRIGRLHTMALIVLGLTLSTAVRGDEQVTARLTMGMQVNGTVTETGCRNSPGPQVTLEGEIALGGLQLELVFRNNIKGTHRASVTSRVDVVLIPLGGEITIPKQPVLGGVGGNPHIWIQFHDGEGEDLTDEIYLGRCVQGLSISPSFLTEVLATTDIAALDCSNHPGPQITVGGTVTFSGLHARFIFRNNLRGTHPAEDTRDVEIIVKGSQVVVPKQPINGGAGGNPIISIQFQDGEGNPIDDPVVLGRCVQL